MPPDAVDDAAQEVFVVASRKLESIELGKETAFLFGTAIRVASDARRAVLRRRLAPADEQAELVDGTPALHELVDQKRAREPIDARPTSSSVASLGVQQRAAPQLLRPLEDGRGRRRPDGHQQSAAAQADLASVRQAAHHTRRPDDQLKAQRADGAGQLLAAGNAEPAATEAGERAVGVGDQRSAAHEHLEPVIERHDVLGIEPPHVELGGALRRPAADQAVERPSRMPTATRR